MFIEYTADIRTTTTHHPDSTNSTPSSSSSSSSVTGFKALCYTGLIS